jgi:protein phosphatase
MNSTPDTPRGDVVVDVSARTDVGRTREHNEDAFVVVDFATDDASLPASGRRQTVGPRGMLLMVADGMGGAAAGEIASAMAIDTLVEELRISWGTHPHPGPDTFVRCMAEAAHAANRKIHLYAGEHPDFRGMGTTATIAGLLGNEVYLVQVGDSRAYLVRDGVARQLTRDQSLMQKLIEAGELTEEEAAHSERRNIILQALGPEPAIKLDVTHQLLRQDDVLVLCSDGLSGQVTREVIAQTVVAHREPSRACETLIDLANRAGGPDNITVVVARFDAPGLEQPHDDDTVGHQRFDTSGAAEPDDDTPTRRVTVPIAASDIAVDAPESVMGIPMATPPAAPARAATPVVSTARRRVGRGITIVLLILLILGGLWVAVRAIGTSWHLGKSDTAAAGGSAQ